MKRIYRTLKISALAVTLVVASCDVIDVRPTHLQDEATAFQNLDNVESHLVGTYSTFRSANYYGSTYGVMADMMTEELAENVESLGNFRSLVDWTYVANDFIIQPAWRTPYVVINNANIVIKNADRLPEDVRGQRARIKGQALAMRALAHFDLLRYFGQSYDRNSTTLGVPVKLDNELTLPGRNTVQETYNQIYADLAEAKTLLGGALDEAINPVTKRTKIDAAVVDAIQARVALYARDYPTAIESATNVIEDYDFSLATGTAFNTVWSEDAVAGEVIWAIAFQPGEGQPGGNVFFSVNNRLSFKPSQSILSLYDETSDIRYDTYFSDEVPLPGRDGQIAPIKYLGRNGSTNGNVNFKVFRLSEMYLIRAEAYANSGQDGLANTDLNELRAARITGYVNETITGDALKSAIATERRKELFLEGHRWFDIRRAGGSINRVDCAAPATQCQLLATSHRWVWPIPQSEVEVNSIIAGQQNNGY